MLPRGGSPERSAGTLDMGLLMRKHGQSIKRSYTA